MDLADRRAGAPTVRLRLGSVCRRTASRDRRGRRARRVGARTRSRDRVVRRLRSRRRSCADDPHSRRLFRDPAATRIDRRAARRGGRPGSAGGCGRREFGCGHARAARPPGRSAHRRRGGLHGPARVSARAPEGRATRARPHARRGGACGAAAVRTARPARRAAQAVAAVTASSRCTANPAPGRRPCADVERGARRRGGGTGRRGRRTGGRLIEADCRGRARRACRSRASTRRRGRDGGPGLGAGGGEPGARAASGNPRRPFEARRKRPGCASYHCRCAAEPA